MEDRASLRVEDRASLGAEPRAPQEAPERRRAQGRLASTPPAATYNPGAVDAFTVSTTISRPREEVFEYLADIANHAEFSDHYLVKWHLLRENSYGVGAGARFHVQAPLNRFSWADLSIVEAQPPYRIVERGRGGKFNRVRILATYTLLEGPSDTTRVEFTLETQPALLSDRLIENLGGRSWLKRKTGRAMRRLRTILEEGRDRGRRPTVAAG